MFCGSIRPAVSGSSLGSNGYHLPVHSDASMEGKFLPPPPAIPAFMCPQALIQTFYTVFTTPEQCRMPHHWALCCQGHKSVSRKSRVGANARFGLEVYCSTWWIQRQHCREWMLNLRCLSIPKTYEGWKENKLKKKKMDEGCRLSNRKTETLTVSRYPISPYESRDTTSSCSQE